MSRTYLEEPESGSLLLPYIRRHVLTSSVLPSSATTPRYLLRLLMSDRSDMAHASGEIATEHP